MMYRLHNKKGSILAYMRQKMVEDAIQGEATHLLFIDSDQMFPRDAAHRLLSRGKQVIGCNVATKMLPSSPTARAKDPTGKQRYLPVYTTESSPAVEKVWRLGTGILLLDLNVFKRPELKGGHWFDQRWNEELKAYDGEDWGLGDALEAAGVSIWVDHELSREIGHVGNLTYTHDHVNAPFDFDLVKAS